MGATRVTAEDDRPMLILVSPMAEATRGYMLRSVASRYRIWLFKEEEPSWERKLVCGYTIVDTLDAAAMIEEAWHIPADGILCWDETRILTSAQLAEGYGLPTMPSGVVRTCRDKLATRQALARAGTSPVAAAPAGNLAEALAVAERIGYPLVIKPRALVGSNGTTLVTDPGQLEAVFDSVAARSMAEVRERFTTPVVLEEYLDGPEISVDSLCWDSVVTPLFVARKDLGFPPYFEEIGHTVDAHDQLLGDPGLRESLTAIHAAVGLTRGWTHTEWRLTADGPRLVEINARSGGDLIPYLGWLVTGVDAAQAAAALALGRQPAVRVQPRGVAAIRFLYPDQDGIAEDVRIQNALLPAALDRVHVLMKPGQFLALPPAAHVTGRYAFAVVRAPTARQCTEALDAAARAVTLIPAEMPPGSRPHNSVRVGTTAS